MQILNPFLYQCLCNEFPGVKISNQGQRMVVDYAPDSNYLRRGRLMIRFLSGWGETYSVNCPFCSDTRGRLAIGHRWAERDGRTGDDMLHLAKCFNEPCLSTREKQKQLHALVFPEGRHALVVDAPKIGLAVSVLAAPQPVSPPEGTVLLDSLPPDHPARRYLMDRGFCPDRLARDYGVGFCESCGSCKPRIVEPRLVIPIFQPHVRLVVPLGGAKDSDQVRLMSWQARLLRPVSGRGDPKYLTAAGTRKSMLLYGLPTAIKASGPIVIVEGVADVWGIGPNALALLGKTISEEQVRLLMRHFRGRPIVVWLDGDAGEDAVKVHKAIRAQRVTAEDPGSIVVAQCPPGRKDPGECTADEVSQVMDQALRTITPWRGRRQKTS